jgi:hypothetical protein
VTERPLVIVGCPRSGTTLLSTMLHAHPRIAIPPETRWLRATYQRRRSFGDLRAEENRRRLAHFITRRKNSKFDDLGISRENTVERIVAAPPTLGSATAAVFEEFAATRDKPRWGEKRPSHAFWLDRLLALWPDLQVVHLVRDPRACVASLMRHPFFTAPLEHAAVMWLRTEREMSGFEKRSRPGQYHRVRYEDLLVDPRRELQRLCTFLDERFDETMLRPAAAAGDIVPQRAAHHVRTRGPVDPSRIEAWREELSAADIGLIEFGCARMMGVRGYQPSRAGARPSIRRTVEFAARYARTAYGQRREQAQDRRERRTEPYPLAAVPRQ